MTPKLKELEKNALRLSSYERAQLAAFLIQTLDEKENADSEKLWIKEAERRYQDYKAGKTKGLPAESVFKEIRSKLK